jgi:hypothetical protein
MSRRWPAPMRQSAPRPCRRPPNQSSALGKCEVGAAQVEHRENATIRRDPKGRGTLVTFDHQHSIAVETNVNDLLSGAQAPAMHPHAISIVSPLALAAGADEWLASPVVELLDRNLAGLLSVPRNTAKAERYAKLALSISCRLKWNRPERHFHDGYLPGVRCARSASGGPLSPRSRSLSMQPKSKRATTAIRSARTSTVVSISDGQITTYFPWSHSFAAHRGHHHELQMKSSVGSRSEITALRMPRHARFFAFRFSFVERRSGSHSYLVHGKATLRLSEAHRACIVEVEGGHDTASKHRCLWTDRGPDRVSIGGWQTT